LTYWTSGASITNRPLSRAYIAGGESPVRRSEPSSPSRYFV
jgi:hypothetical protein